eukprot:gene5944-4253_t
MRSISISLFLCAALRCLRICFVGDTTVHNWSFLHPPLDDESWGGTQPSTYGFWCLSLPILPFHRRIRLEKIGIPGLPPPPLLFNTSLLAQNGDPYTPSQPTSKKPSPPPPPTRQQQTANRHRGLWMSNRLSRYQERLNELHEAMFGFRSTVEKYLEPEEDPQRQAAHRPGAPLFTSYGTVGGEPRKKHPYLQTTRRRTKVAGGLQARRKRTNAAGQVPLQGGELDGSAYHSYRTDDDSSCSVELEEMGAMFNVPNRYFRQPGQRRQKPSSSSSASSLAPHDPAAGGRPKRSPKRPARPADDPGTRGRGRRPRGEQTQRSEPRRVPQGRGSDVSAPPSSRSPPRSPARECRCDHFEERGRAVVPKTSRSTAENVLRWAAALGVKTQFVLDKQRVYRRFVEDPKLHRRRWERLCKASQATFQRVIPEAQALAYAATPRGRRASCSESPSLGTTRRSGSRQYRTNKALRSHREYEEWCRWQLKNFFDRPTYLREVWRGFAVRDINPMLGGRYVIPSAEHIEKDAEEYRKFCRRGMALRRLLLQELGLDRIGNGGELKDDDAEEAEGAGSEWRSFGVDGDENEKESSTSGSQKSNPSSDGLRHHKVPVDMGVAVTFNDDSHQLELRFYCISVDDAGEEQEVFLGNWRAGCLDNWRWLVLNGPLKHKVVFFDTHVPQRHATRSTSGAGKEIPQHSAGNFCAVPAVSVLIGTMVFQRVRRPEASPKHFVCSRCGKFFVEAKAARFERNGPRERCWVCRRRTDLIPVSSSFEADKKEFLRTLTYTATNRRVPDSVMRQRVKEMVNQSRYELEHRPPLGNAKVVCSSHHRPLEVADHPIPLPPHIPAVVVNDGVAVILLRLPTVIYRILKGTRAAPVTALLISQTFCLPGNLFFPLLFPFSTLVYIYKCILFYLVVAVLARLVRWSAVLNLAGTGQHGNDGICNVPPSASFDALRWEPAAGGSPTLSASGSRSLSEEVFSGGRFSGFFQIQWSCSEMQFELHAVSPPAHVGRSEMLVWDQGPGSVPPPERSPTPSAPPSRSEWRVQLGRIFESRIHCLRRPLHLCLGPEGTEIPSSVLSLRKSYAYTLFGPVGISLQLKEGKQLFLVLQRPQDAEALLELVHQRFPSRPAHAAAALAIFGATSSTVSSSSMKSAKRKGKRKAVQKPHGGVRLRWCGSSGNNFEHVYILSSKHRSDVSGERTLVHLCKNKYRWWQALKVSLGISSTPSALLDLHGAVVRAAPHTNAFSVEFPGEGRPEERRIDVLVATVEEQAAWLAWFASLGVTIHHVRPTGQQQTSPQSSHTIETDIQAVLKPKPKLKSAPTESAAYQRVVVRRSQRLPHGDPAVAPLSVPPLLHFQRTALIEAFMRFVVVPRMRTTTQKSTSEWNNELDAAEVEVLCTGGGGMTESRLLADATPSPPSVDDERETPTSSSSCSDDFAGIAESVTSLSPPISVYLADTSSSSSSTSAFSALPDAAEEKDNFELGAMHFSAGSSSHRSSLFPAVAPPREVSTVVVERAAACRFTMGGVEVRQEVSSCSGGELKLNVEDAVLAGEDAAIATQTSFSPSDSPSAAETPYVIPYSFFTPVMDMSLAHHQLQHLQPPILRYDDEDLLQCDFAVAQDKNLQASAAEEETVVAAPMTSTASERYRRVLDDLLCGAPRRAVPRSEKANARLMRGLASGGKPGATRPLRPGLGRLNKNAVEDIHGMYPASARRLEIYFTTPTFLRSTLFFFETNHHHHHQKKGPHAYACTLDESYLWGSGNWMGEIKKKGEQHQWNSCVAEPLFPYHSALSHPVRLMSGLMLPFAPFLELFVEIESILNSF